MTAGLFLAPVWLHLITEGFKGWLAGSKHSRGSFGSTAAAGAPGRGAGQVPWETALGIHGPFEEGTSLRQAGAGQWVQMGLTDPSTSRDGSME